MSGVNCSSVAYVCVSVGQAGGASQGPEANVPSACWREVDNH